jgi:hypothetical protein
MALPQVIIRPDGSLYCDVSVKSLDFSQYTPLMNLPIKYDESKFREMGKLFVEYARSTCPVDTGYLRNHNDYSADAGGVEMWSEAYYSVYQEYGTSRCRAQPWFESSILSALAESGIEENFKALEVRYLHVDSLLNELYTMAFITKADALHGLKLCRNLKAEFDLLGIDDDIVDLVDQIISEIKNNIAAIEEQERAMRQSSMGWRVEQIIIAIIVGIIASLIKMMIDILIGGMRSIDANPHNPRY